MPKKKTSAPASKEADADLTRIADDVQAANTLAVIELSKQDYEADRDLANQLLGQAQMADSIAKLTATVAVSKMAYVKEKKLYQALKGVQNRDGRGCSGTWEEFCQLLGTSAPKVNEDIANLQVFGEAALESMTSMGIGYRDLRQFRRLPTDQKAELIEAAKAGDTATLLELAEDLMAKHIKEKAKLQQDLAAKDQRIARHQQTIAEFEDKEDKWAAQPVHAQVATSVARALGLVQGELRQGFVALADAHKARGMDPRQGKVLLAGYLGQLQHEINALREEHMLTDLVGDCTPEWKKWAEANPNGHPDMPDSATWRPAA